MPSEERDTRIPYRLGTGDYCKFEGRDEYVHMGDLVEVYHSTCDGDDVYFGDLSGVWYDYNGFISGVTLAALDGSCSFNVACDGVFQHARLIK